MPFTAEQQQAIDAANARIAGGQAAPAPASSFTPEQQQILEAASTRTAAPASVRPLPHPQSQYRTELQKLTEQKGIDPGSSASASGVFAGFDDELSAAVNAPFHAAYDWYKGKDFDVGRSYTSLQQEADRRKQRRRRDAPISSLAGEVIGGLATGGLAKAPGAVLAAPGYVTAVKTAIAPTIARVTQAAPKATQYAKVATAGAGYGGLSGAGEAKPGERLEGAKKGAVIGALTAGGTQAVGNKIVSTLTNRAGKKAIATSGDLASAKNALYDASEAAGMVIKQPTLAKLRQNLKIMAGKINPYNRPITAGQVADVDARLTADMTLRELDEFRQSLAKDVGAAKGNDQRVLMQMKEHLDTFIDHLGPGDYSGGAAAIPLIKEARQLSIRERKTKVIEDLLDLADVNAQGRYTQSGIVNATRRKMKTLYEQIKKGQQRNWTKEEVALIRQMASGGSNSQMLKLLSKFDPKGVVSATLGFAISGPVLPLAGHVAARMRERGMEAASQRLLSGAASGGPMAAVTPPARNLGAAATGATAASMEADRRLRALQGR